MTTVDIDVLVERTKMALAEAGYPDANIAPSTHDANQLAIWWSGTDVCPVPDKVLWRAFRLVVPERNPCVLRLFLGRRSAEASRQRARRRLFQGRERRRVTVERMMVYGAEPPVWWRLTTPEQETP